jgi:hypothetical protein
LSKRWNILGLFLAKARNAPCSKRLVSFPTYYLGENQPVNLIEAMAHGLPIITTRWRSLPEMFPADYPGLVSIKSPERIAAAILNVMTRKPAKDFARCTSPASRSRRISTKLAEAITATETPVTTGNNPPLAGPPLKPATRQIHCGFASPRYFSRVRIGVLQLNSTIGAYAANRDRLLAAYAQAVREGAEFVIAPELFLCGYPPRDLLLRPDFIEANLNALEQTAASVGAVPLCVGFVDRNTEPPRRRCSTPLPCSRTERSSGAP